MRYISLLLLLSGCTAAIRFNEREGFTKAELIEAFKARDQALNVLTEKLIALEAEREEK